MYQHEIKAAIDAAANIFAVQLGWINEPWRVNQILPSGETALLDDEVVTKMVSIQVGSFSFDFLAIVQGPMSCTLYMDTRTAILVTELKLRELRDEVHRELKEHLMVYPHNMGM